MDENEKKIFLAYAHGEITKEEAQARTGWKKAAFNNRMRSLGFTSESHFFPGRSFKALIPKDDEDFWKKIHARYHRDNVSLGDICSDLGIRASTVKAQFERFSLPLKSKEVTEIARIEKSLKAMKKSGGIGLQNKETLKRQQKTIRERYGVENVSELKDVREKISGSHLSRDPSAIEASNEKRRETSIKKYGTEYVTQNDSVQNKIIATNLNRYGVPVASASIEVRKKIQQTNLSRYGGISPLSNPNVIESRVQTIQEEKAVRLVSSLAQYDYKLLEPYRGLFHTTPEGKRYTRYDVQHIKCGNIFKDDLYLLPRCQKCFPLEGMFSSQLETILGAYIKGRGVRVHKNNRDIIKNPETGRPFELDLYMADRNLAIEVNSLYHHSSQALSWGRPISKNYHKNKTEGALKEGINLLHIWDDWEINIIKSILDFTLGFSKKKDARKLKIVSVDCTHFFNENHVYGDVPCNAQYALVEGNNIFAAASFRYHKEGLELARFASLCGYSVRGGFTRLLQHAINTLKPKTIISYCDRDLSPSAENTVYAKNGFTLVKETGPRLFYTDFKQRWSREKFQKKNLKNLFPDVYDDKLTADEILARKKIFPLWNSGNWKFIKKTK